MKKLILVIFLVMVTVSSLGSNVNYTDKDLKNMRGYKEKEEGMQNIHKELFDIEMKANLKNRDFNPDSYEKVLKRSYERVGRSVEGRADGEYRDIIDELYDSFFK